MNNTAKLTPSSEFVAEVLNKQKKHYGKLWPLQTFNACNPLVAYEQLPFLSALQEAEHDLGFSIEQSVSVLKSLYQKQVFTFRELDLVLCKDTNPILDKTITLNVQQISYRALLLRELDWELSQTNFQIPEIAGPEESENKIKSQLIAYIQDRPELTQKFSDVSNVQWINEQVVKWLAVYLDDGQALWQMPHQELRLRYAWANLVLHDNQLEKNVRINLKKFITNFIKPGSSSLETLYNFLSFHNASVDQIEQLFNIHLKQMPGWVGYINYCESTKKDQEHLLSDYLLIRLMYHFAYQPKLNESALTLNSVFIVRKLRNRLFTICHAFFSKSSSNETLSSIILENFSQCLEYIEEVSHTKKLLYMIEALEHSQNHPLVLSLTQACNEGTDATTCGKTDADAQVVFCIDVRSEPYRRLLESSGNIETYGFAGFFGLPIAMLGFSSEEAISLCPIILKPQYIIKQTPSYFLENNPISLLIRLSIPFREQWIYSLKKINRDIFATFAYVEGFGIVHSLMLLKDSFASVPFGKVFQRILHSLTALSGLIPNLESETSTETIQKTGIVLPEQVELSKNILKLLGLREPYSEFVILCGHTSRTYNNPYASSLDCGACGANGGGFNALVLSQMLNHPDIREALFLEGIHIPEHTQFIAAEHNTTTDEVTFLNREIIPPQQQLRFLSIEKTFANASASNLINRQVSLKEHGGVSYGANALTPSYDWSQTRPEWGLSKNQAFFIGKRESIRKLDLEGRCFLHSYGWDNDPDGEILSTIMTAPMIVGAWINLQYCFSTLDQQRFGSGHKYIHNIVGLFGTYLGNASDLQLGLPYESLFANAGFPYHYPQRLLVYIQAPLDRIKTIIESHQNIQNLVENQWVQLKVFDPEEKRAYEFSDSVWKSINPSLSNRIS